jgi:hypothetical protein
LGQFFKLKIRDQVAIFRNLNDQFEIFKGKFAMIKKLRGQIAIFINS